MLLEVRNVHTGILKFGFDKTQYWQCSPIVTEILKYEIRIYVYCPTNVHFYSLLIV
jgi:hypothetical protein